VGPVEWVTGIPVEWVIGIGGLLLGVVILVVGVKIANRHAKKASAELSEGVDRLHLHLQMTNLAIYMEEAGIIKDLRLATNGRLKLWQRVSLSPPATSRKTDREPHRDALRLCAGPRSSTGR
jgi:hypothetical protein